MANFSLSASSRGDLEARQTEVSDFNAANAFKKRGLAVVPMRWRHGFGIYKYAVQVGATKIGLASPIESKMSNLQVVAYEKDGSVAVSVGGIEMGQGLNTKVAQVVGRKLGVSDIGLISVKASNTTVHANVANTGGSFGSDCCAIV